VAAKLQRKKKNEESRMKNLWDKNTFHVIKQDFFEEKRPVE